MHNLDTSSSYYNPMSSAQDNGRHFDSGGSNFNQSGRHVDIQGRHLEPHCNYDMNDRGDFNNTGHKGNQ